MHPALDINVFAMAALTGGLVLCALNCAIQTTGSWRQGFTKTQLAKMSDTTLAAAYSRRQQPVSVNAPRSEQEGHTAPARSFYLA